MPDQKLLAEMLLQVKVVLPEKTLEQLLWFRDELLRWNKKINLTAITDPVGTLEKHLVDSLTLLPYLGKEGTVLDMGSGGGFPCIPLKIARPKFKVWSVDAVAKKIAFQKHVSRNLKLHDFVAIHERLEELPENKSLPLFDLIVTRAFAPLKTILSLADPLLAKNGQILAMKGAEGIEELTGCQKDLKEWGFQCDQAVEIQLPKSRAERTLLFLSKNYSG